MPVCRLLLIVPLLIIPLAAQAEICRWVDSNGTVHYANECPEDVEGSEVKLDPGPSAEQVREAQENFPQSQLSEQVREDALTELAPEPADANPPDAEICIDAELAVDALERPVPVYFDEAGNLHHGRSKHSETYQGERHYLDDAERQEELARARRLISQHCGEAKSDIIEQSEELQSRLKERMCADYEAEAERMIRSREGGSADRARQLIEYCESDGDD
jgi:hypothetical protein